MHPNESTLNEYVEETLAPGERIAVQRHLESCEACRQVATGFDEVRRAAAALDPIEPPADLWSRIERALLEDMAAQAEDAPGVDQDQRSRVVSSIRTERTSFQWPWLAAAAALVLATIVGLQFGPLPSWMPGRSSPSAADTHLAQLAQTIEAELELAEQHYQKAISRLEQIAKDEQDVLDPTIAATLQENLAVIDRAIGESRAALNARPDSQPAQLSLLDSFKTKMTLLQDTVTLITAMRAGTGTGVERIASGS